LDASTLTPPEPPNGSSAAPHSPMAEQEYRLMRETEDQLWWYRLLHRKVVTALRRAGVKGDAPILDVGCGTGGVLSALRTAGFSAACGLDVSPLAVQICNERGLSVALGDAREIGAAVGTRRFTAIICNDVLCYFDSLQAQAVMAESAALLTPGGVLVLNVPAYAAFAGMHDRAVGIQHRATRAELEKQLQQTGFEITELQAWPLFLAPLIALARAGQRWNLRLRPSARICSDVKPVAPWLNNLLLLCSCVEELLPACCRRWASSLFVCASKRSGTQDCTGAAGH
jgi:SAM-dependent methyltransferase